MSDSHEKALTVRAEGRMHPMVEAAMAAGPDPATLRELLAVQREWERGEAKKAFDRAMVDLKRDLPAVLERDKVVDFTSKKGRTCYRHTSLAAAADAVVPILTQHGFAHSWTPKTDGGRVHVTCELTHTEGHSKTTTLDSQPDTSGLKGPAQAIASTITLLQRYTLLSLLGIATADMPEPHGPREPTPEEAEKVDPSRSLKCAAWLKEQGKSRAEAERHVGRKVAQWTAADLTTLLAWARKEDTAAESTPPGYERDPNTGELVPLPGAED